MTRRKTHEEFVAEVKALVGDEYTVVGRYKNTMTKIELLHQNCNEIYSVVPAAFLTGNRCLHCSGMKKKTTEEFKQDVFNLVGDEYEVLGEYKTNKTKIAIKHNTCENVYSPLPKDFISGKSRCSICARGYSFSSAQEIIKKYSDDKFELLEITNTARKGSRHKLVCKMCGLVRVTNISRVKRGEGCPKCLGVKPLTTQEFADRVTDTTLGEYELVSKYRKNSDYVKILHKTCGEVYKVTPNSFTRGTRCPICRESKGESKIRLFLNKNKIAFTREYTVGKRGEKGHMRFDFNVQGVAIEYDGKQHFEPVDAWGGAVALRETQRRDRIKNKYCADNGIPLIRIPYWEFDNIDAILTEKLLPLLMVSRKFSA